MASLSIAAGLSRKKVLNGPFIRCSTCVYRQGLQAGTRSQPNQFAVSRRLFSQQSQQRPRFSSRLRTALRNSKIQWYQIPVGVGIGFLGCVQFYKVYTREQEKQEREEQGLDGEKRPRKRARIRPDGPWYAQDGVILHPHNQGLMIYR